MLKIGLTGGIGCGKSTVSNLFADLGVSIIDADKISHRLVQIGQPALQEIKHVLGSKFLLENGALNRPFLKNYIFENPQVKQQLEAILHPRIFQEIATQIQSITTTYCILSIPLLFETNAQFLVDRILVVDCDAKTQIERVKQRDNLAFESIQAIIATQMPAEFKKQHAHDLIDNSKNAPVLAEQVKKLHNFYLSLSHR